MPRVPLFQFVEVVNPGPNEASFRLVPASLVEPAIPLEIVSRIESITQQLIHYLHRSCPHKRVVKLVADFCLDDNGQLWLVHTPDVRCEPNPTLRLPKLTDDPMYALLNSNVTSLSAIGNAAVSEKQREFVQLEDGSVHPVHYVGKPDVPYITVRDLTELKSAPNPHPSLAVVASAMYQAVTGIAKDWKVASQQFRGNGVDDFLNEMRKVEGSPTKVFSEELLEAMRPVLTSKVFIPGMTGLGRIGALGEKLGLWVLGVVQAALEYYGCPGYDHFELMQQIYAEAKAAATSRSILMHAGAAVLAKASAFQQHGPVLSVKEILATEQLADLGPAQLPPENKESKLITALRSNPLRQSLGSSNLRATQTLARSKSKGRSDTQKTQNLGKDTTVTASTTTTENHNNATTRSKTINGTRPLVNGAPDSYVNTVEPAIPMEPAPKPVINQTKSSPFADIPGVTESGNFICADGKTTFPWVVLGSRSSAFPERNSIVIINDIFDCLSQTAAVLAPAIEKEGLHVLLFNLPGQAHTTFAPYKGISNQSNPVDDPAPLFFSDITSLVGNSANEDESLAPVPKIQLPPPLALPKLPLTSTAFSEIDKITRDIVQKRQEEDLLSRLEEEKQKQKLLGPPAPAQVHPEVLNSEFHASCLQQLLVYLNGMRFFLTSSAPWQFDVIGLGLGGSVALSWATRYATQYIASERNTQTVIRDTHGRAIRSVKRGLRSVILCNGSAYIDPQLKTILQSTASIFSKFSVSRPDLPIQYMSRFLFSDKFLSVVPREVATARWHGTPNLITLGGRLALIFGMLQNQDIRSVVGRLPVPLVLLSSEDDTLVAPSNSKQIAALRGNCATAHAEEPVPPVLLQRPYMGTGGYSSPVDNASSGSPVAPGMLFFDTPLSSNAVETLIQTLHTPASTLHLKIQSGHEVRAERPTTFLDFLSVLTSTDSAEQRVARTPSPYGDQVPIWPSNGDYVSPGPYGGGPYGGGPPPGPMDRRSRLSAGRNGTKSSLSRAGASVLDGHGPSRPSSTGAYPSDPTLHDPYAPYSSGGGGRGYENHTPPPYGSLSSSHLLQQHQQQQQQYGPGMGKSIGGGEATHECEPAASSSGALQSAQTQDVSASNDANAPEDSNSASRTLQHRSRSPPPLKNNTSEHAITTPTRNEEVLDITQKSVVSSSSTSSPNANKTESRIRKRKDPEFVPVPPPPDMLKEVFMDMELIPDRAFSAYQHLEDDPGAWYYAVLPRLGDLGWERNTRMLGSLLTVYNSPPPLSEDEAERVKKKQREDNSKMGQERKITDSILSARISQHIDQKNKHYETENADVLSNLTKIIAKRRLEKGDTHYEDLATTEIAAVVAAARTERIYKQAQEASNIELPTLPLGPLRQDNMEFARRLLEHSADTGGETTLYATPALTQEEYEEIRAIPFALAAVAKEEAIAYAEAKAAAAAEELLRLQHIAATKIQARWRGIEGRRRARRMKYLPFFFHKELWAALKVQRMYRKNVEIFRHMRLRREQSAAWRIHNAAVDIQRIARGFLARVSVHAMRLHKCARDIQRVWRGYLGRNEVRVIKEAKAAVDRLHGLAAKIQATWRMFAARRDYHNLRIMTLAAIQLQRWIRGYRARVEFRKKLAIHRMPLTLERVLAGNMRLMDVGSVYLDMNSRVSELRRALERTERDLQSTNKQIKDMEEVIAGKKKEIEESIKSEMEVKGLIFREGAVEDACRVDDRRALRESRARLQTGKGTVTGASGKVQELERLTRITGVNLPVGLHSVIHGKKSMKETAAMQKETEFEVQLALRDLFAKKMKVKVEIEYQIGRLEEQLQPLLQKREILQRNQSDITTALLRNEKGLKHLREEVSELITEQEYLLEITKPPEVIEDPTFEIAKNVQRITNNVVQTSNMHNKVLDQVEETLRYFTKAMLPEYVASSAMVKTSKSMNMSAIIGQADRLLLEDQARNHVVNGVPLPTLEDHEKQLRNTLSNLMGPLAPGGLLEHAVSDNLALDLHKRAAADRVGLLLMESRVKERWEVDEFDLEEKSGGGLVSARAEVNEARMLATSIPTSRKGKLITEPPSVNPHAAVYLELSKEGKQLFERAAVGTVKELEEPVDPALEPPGMFIPPMGQEIVKGTGKTAGLVSALDLVKIVDTPAGLTRQDAPTLLAEGKFGIPSNVTVPGVTPMSKLDVAVSHERELHSPVSLSTTAKLGEPLPTIAEDIELDLTARSNRRRRPSLEVLTQIAQGSLSLRSIIEREGGMKEGALDHEKFMQGQIQQKTEEGYLAGSYFTYLGTQRQRIQAYEEVRKTLCTHNWPKKVRDWTIADVSAWLYILAMGRYVSIFADAAIDGEALLTLKPKVFRDTLNITIPEHLGIILHAREELRIADVRNDTTLALSETNALRLTASNAALRGPASDQLATLLSEDAHIPKPSNVFAIARLGHTRKIENFLKRGFPAAITENESGNSLLHVALMHGHRQMCHVLLNRGANVNHPNKAGNTPLHYCRDPVVGSAIDPEGHFGNYLVARGADEQAKNQWGFEASSGMGPLEDERVNAERRTVLLGLELDIDSILPALIREQEIERERIRSNEEDRKRREAREAKRKASADAASLPAGGSLQAARHAARKIKTPPSTFGRFSPSAKPKFNLQVGPNPSALSPNNRNPYDTYSSASSRVGTASSTTRPISRGSIPGL